MWSEPLTTTVRGAGATRFRVSVLDAEGVPVAGVECAVNIPARCGMFGAIVILDDNGGPKQTERAMVLLVRGALAHAAELGIRRVETPRIPDRLRDFAERVAGHPTDYRKGGRRMRGDLADIRTQVLDRTNDDGTEKERARGR